jgi:dCMP deaminase
MTPLCEDPGNCPLHDPEPTPERISREQMFMAMAKTVALRSTCLRAHVGAILVVDGRVVSMGYNGAPPGMAHCLDIGCAMLGGAELGCQRTVHAEANCVAYAARRGISAQDATLYTTHSPCRVCSMLLASAGVKNIVYTEPYRATDWVLLGAMGIKAWRPE